MPASTLGEQRKREKEEAYRCFDWSMLPAKTTQPITVTVPRNCRVSRFTKTGEGYPFEIPRGNVPPFLFYYAGRHTLSHGRFLKTISIVLLSSGNFNPPRSSILIPSLSSIPLPREITIFPSSFSLFLLYFRILRSEKSRESSIFSTDSPRFFAIRSRKTH